jgi:hypothetical protein
MTLLGSSALRANKRDQERHRGDPSELGRANLPRFLLVLLNLQGQ